MTMYTARRSLHALKIVQKDIPNVTHFKLVCKTPTTKVNDKIRNKLRRRSAKSVDKDGHTVSKNGTKEMKKQIL